MNAFWNDLDPSDPNNLRHVFITSYSTFSKRFGTKESLEESTEVDTGFNAYDVDKFVQLDVDQTVETGRIVIQQSNATANEATGEATAGSVGDNPTPDDDDDSELSELEDKDFDNDPDLEHLREVNLEEDETSDHDDER